jgi:hypothetical protein
LLDADDVLSTKIHVASIKAHIGFDKNLVSVQEQVQDKAFQEYYSKGKLTKEKQKIMCYVFKMEQAYYCSYFFDLLTGNWTAELSENEKGTEKK